ncbi:MAG: S41 family peptidase [Spirochaetaceae bacterium]|nr:MAG: S41 family peptidase [Spirochaetaceae bacterium]
MALPEPTGRRSSRRERALWTTLTAIAIGLVLIVAIAPTLLAQSNSDSDRALEVFENVFRFVRDNYVDEVDADVLLRGALRGLFESLDDPYSAYLDVQDMRGLTDTTTGQFGGVGMYISKQRTDPNDERSGFVEIVAPIEDTPAYRAGIRAGDLIVALRDEGADEFTSTQGLSIDEVVDRLRGTPGTRVTIRIRRGERAEFPVTLERAIIQVPTTRHAMVDDQIAFLRIIQFTPRTVEAVTTAIREFEAAGYRSMIIDLRTNPGGLLDAVIDVADLFFSGGTIVGTAGRVPQENRRFDARPGITVDREIQVVVLINEGSASAAEILAGALQDRGRAYLIGETTFGKGSVQQVRRIANGGFRLTMSRYYLPSGRYIDQVGVSPDLPVQTPQLTDEQSESYAALLNTERIRSWVAGTPDPSPADIDRLIDAIRADGYDVPDRWIRIRVRDEINRANNVQPVFDLEFDQVVGEAIRLLRSGPLPIGR